ncbi:30S ribosomal protein S27ae [Methanocaldococcus infernus]|uniref:Small ribosomal subunit protein eS31 n=1 Tax=Methanocaldococcus infernus (strain DSM 11812 / JCM 15783 / ME) TaxID=573063 RepID=D5VT19_METIM|nr:30S ribosomal protein S27ae [Methanocaldococcus infernus]ADG13722.1 Ribosomal protein S27a [Methanocaldococcus infernus ME]
MTKGKKTAKYKYYKVEGDKVVRLKRFCPKCGPGVFLAEHLNRYSCGRCGYMEWKQPAKKEE